MDAVTREGTPLDTRHLRRRLIRAFAGVVGLGLLTACGIDFGPKATRKVPHVGVLWQSPDIGPDTPHFTAFRQGLRNLGYIEDRNLVLEWRYAEASVARLPGLATELVRMGVDVIFTPGVLATRAAKASTATIPIVGINNDPVAAGLVSSLASPGGNVTGLATLYTGTVSKRVEKFKDAVPEVGRVGILWNPEVPDKAANVVETQAAAQTLGIETRPFEVRGAADLDGAFRAVAGWHTDGIITLLDPYAGSYQPETIAFATSNRVPTICEGSGFPMKGGLMSYGPNQFALFGRAASYVDRILKGDNPASMPVEQPTRIELVINLKTAQAIGRTIPRLVLLEADQVIT